MFWEKLIRYLAGYVEFRAVGGFPERFINLCASNKISVQEIRMCDETITGICGIKDYCKIRTIAKKSGMKVRLISKRGLPFFIRRNRKRKGIVAGFALMIIITFLLSGRIWVINVSGNETIPSEDIVSMFEELGVKIGARKDSIDPKSAAFQAVKNSDSLMWCAVNLDGCKAGIEIREEVQKNVENESEEPSNIVASKSGQIKVVECFRGTPVVQVGSAAEKGDVLVSGAVINKDESVSFCRADAKVIALTSNEIEVSEKKTVEMRVYTKVKGRHHVNFFSVVFPVNFVFEPKENFSFFTEESFLSSDGGKLPAGIRSEKYACYEKKKITMSDKTLLLLCGEKYFRYINEEFDNISIEKMTSEIVNDKKEMKICASLDCLENIGEEKRMDIHIGDDALTQ